MSENILARLFEHNNWANEQIIQTCTGLSDEQLDAEPQSAALGSIRSTLTHLVAAQRGYLNLLTLPPEARVRTPLAFSELQESAQRSGAGLLTLAQNTSQLAVQVQSTDGYLIAPWVVMVQVINHATEHREQISNMLSGLGITPPSLDAWSYGEVTNALVPMAK